MTPTAAGLAEKSGEAVKAGPIGLAIILILCIACYFLFKSMSRHMRNVRENFPVDAPPAPPASRTPARPSVARAVPSRTVTTAGGPAPITASADVDHGEAVDHGDANHGDAVDHGGVGSDSDSAVGSDAEPDGGARPGTA